MPRYFTRDEAERILPQVREAVREALFHKQEYQRVEEDIGSLKQNIALSGGMSVNPDKVKSLQETRESSARQLHSAFERIQTFGCLVKDLDIGLLDFPTKYHRKEVYLCWRLGEERIEFWHGIDEGFRGRKPIDAEFLANHEGDAS